MAKKKPYDPATQGQDIAAELRKARRSKEKSLEGLAAEAKVTAQTLNNIESLRRSPTLETILKALAPLGKRLVVVDIEPAA